MTPDDLDRLRWRKDGLSWRMEALIRMAGVKRWHIVETTRTQSLAEHLYAVGMLSYEMATALDHPHPEEVAMWGFQHDLPEVFLGDPPSPAKNGEHRDAEEKLMIAMEIDPASSWSVWLVKMADHADALRFIRQYGVGGIARWSEVTITVDLARLIGEVPRAVSPGTMLLPMLTVLSEYVYETGVEAVQGPFGINARRLARMET